MPEVERFYKSVRCSATIVSICVVTNIGTHIFYLVCDMGTQFFRLITYTLCFVKTLLCVSDLVSKSCFIYESNFIGIFVSIFIIATNYDFFNNTFKNTSVKLLQHFILRQCLFEILHSSL